MGVFFVDEGASMDLWFPAEGGMASNPKGRGQYVQPIKSLPSPKALKHIYIGINGKTMFSINVRIADNCEILTQFPNVGLPYIGPSCRPTEWCLKHCYAKAGLMAFSNQQRTYFANSMYFHTATPEMMAKDARRVIKKCRRYGINNIRLSGGGDLSPGYVRFINIAADIDENFVWWGMTKRADLIRKVNQRPNIIFQFSIDPTSPGLAGVMPNPDRCKSPYQPPPMTLDKFVPTAKARGWNFCYASDQRVEHDVQLNFLRVQGFPIQTVFGDHIGDSHFDTGDMMQCPCTHPYIVPFYESLSEKIPLPRKPGGKQKYRVEYPYWPESVPRGKGGAPSICQTCRWCITAPKDRARKLPWRTPMGSLQAFAEASGGRLWVWGKERGRFVRNPDGDAQFWAEVDHDMANMDPWFWGG